MIAAAVLLTAAVATLGAVGVTAAMQPGCESCHMDRAKFAEATNSTVHAKNDTACVSCHVQDDLGGRTKFATYQVFGMYIPALDPSATDATVVKDKACLRCHEAVAEGTVESKGLRIAHASCAQGRSCIQCHSEVGHAAATSWPRTVSMNDCVSCHRERKVPITCETCHVGKVEVATSSLPEFAVTHGPNWQQTHGMGEMSSCSTCHPADSCSKCHGPGVPHESDFRLRHAEVSQQPGAACASCHEQTFCDSCHQTEMPHPRAFVKSHSSIVAQDGDASCLRCHVSEDCTTCHVKHVHPGGAVGNIPSPEGGGD